MREFTQMVIIDKNIKLTGEPLVLSLSVYGHAEVGWSIPLPGHSEPTLTQVQHRAKFTTWLVVKNFTTGKENRLLI